VFPSSERGLDVRRLRVNGQRYDNGSDIRAGEERGIVFTVIVVGVGVDVALGDGGEGSGRDKGAREDSFELEEGSCFDSGLKEGLIWIRAL
jgi:hypothetical protein